MQTEISRAEEKKGGDRQSPTPAWINKFLIFTASLFCASVLLVSYFGAQEEHSVHGRAIADLTINLAGRPVREHCTTCHPRGARSAHSGQPAKEHPNISPHSPAVLGCTGCHLGEGMALDTEISHGLPGLGGRKLLAREDLQASCYRCHELSPLPGAERAWSGFQLFGESACDTCHHVSGLREGGRYGPDLSRIGSLLGVSKIEEAIRDPRREPPNSTMPRFPLSHEEIRDLSLFLKSRVEDPAYATPMVRRSAERAARQAITQNELPPAGEELLKRKRCLACHPFRDQGTWIGPDLTRAGAMRSPEYLRIMLMSPGRVLPGALMPVVRLTPAEMEALVGHLSRQGRDERAEGDPKHLYMTLCQPCHAANGDGRGMIQPNLANFPRAFLGNAEFFRAVSDERIVRSVTDGIPGTSMPPYGRVMTKEALGSVLDLVFRAFVRVGKADKAPLAPLPTRPPTSASAAAVEDAWSDLCARCHGRAGNGKGPEYLEHLPRPRNLTNHIYFASVGDERIARAMRDGVPGTSMKSFGSRLGPSLLWGLVDRVRELSRTEHGER